MAEITFTITDLAREFGLTTRAIRFYEDQGLLHPQRAGRNRVYANRDRVRLKLTLRGKRLGLSLSEIRELIDMYDAAKGDRGQLERFLEVLEKRRGALEQQREDIEAVLGEISSFEKRCRELLKRKGVNPPKKRIGKKGSEVTV
ncbi:MAG: MerR family DNA-binding transcriptional regulator [Burkholderiales bacterium]|jgi:DNA-binding transcriptional MerR regulator